MALLCPSGQLERINNVKFQTKMQMGLGSPYHFDSSRSGRRLLFNTVIKKLWLIWARTVDHRIGKTNDDEPDIPILSLGQAQVSLLFRTLILLVNVITCFFIISNIIHKW